MKNVFGDLTKERRDILGDRLKGAELYEAGRRASSGLPLMARLDGRAFHTFTKGLRRPYDERLSNLMNDTTAYLVEQTHAVVGYTQSDEITLCWLPSQEYASSYMFDGRFQKIASVLAGMASAFFAKKLKSYIPEKEHAIPHFDCRVWSVENIEEVFLNYLWRQDDAIKNSISMAAQAQFSHNQLHKVGSEGKKKMLCDKGFPWEDEPDFFKYGSFLRRVTKDVELTEEQLNKIPEKFRPTGPVPRSSVERLNIGYIKSEPDILNILFG